MTYKEFEEEIEKLGLKIFSLNMVVGTKDDKDIFNKPICFVGANKRYDIYIAKDFYKLDENLQKKLFELVMDLAKTPLDERGCLKKVILKEVWYGII